LVVLSGGCCFRRAGSGADTAGSTVKAGPVIAAVADVLAVSVVNNGRIDAAHRGVIGKVTTLPAAAVTAASAIAKAIIHAAIETDGRSPVARRPKKSVGKALGLGINFQGWWRNPNG